eukprot:jgi/Mesvir1/5954/Mv25206-RA.1
MEILYLVWRFCSLSKIPIVALSARHVASSPPLSYAHDRSRRGLVFTLNHVWSSPGWSCPGWSCPLSSCPLWSCPRGSLQPYLAPLRKLAC